MVERAAWVGIVGDLIARLARIAAEEPKPLDSPLFKGDEEDPAYNANCLTIREWDENASK
jgi:hypothetical protein